MVMLVIAMNCSSRVDPHVTVVLRLHLHHQHLMLVHEHLVLELVFAAYTWRDMYRSTQLAIASVAGKVRVKSRMGLIVLR
jgi:hypothetical protein